MSTGAPVRPMRVPVRPPSVTSRWVGAPAAGRDGTAVPAPRPRRRAGGGTAIRGCPLVRRSERMTRMAARTKSQSNARNPNRISWRERAEFIGPPRSRRVSRALLVEHDARVPHPDDVAVAEQLAADLVAVDGGAVRRAEVVGGGEVAVVLDVDMPAGDALVEQLQVAVGAAADDVAAPAQIEAPVGLIDDQHGCGRATLLLLRRGRRRLVGGARRRGGGLPRVPLLVLRPALRLGLRRRGADPPPRAPRGRGGGPGAGSAQAGPR